MRVPMTDQACLRLARDGRIRVETVQRMPQGAFAPLARDGSGQVLPRLRELPTPSWRCSEACWTSSWRIAVGNDRQEQYRLPGMLMGLVLAGVVAPSEAGDLEDQYRWLDSQKWFGILGENVGTPTSERDYP